MGEQKIVIGGRYELVSLIGRGGMGDVYKGLDTQTGEWVAVKLLHSDVLAENPNLLDRFNREGQALGKLNHPNIVKVLAMLEENEQHYLVMEYVGGGSLRDLLDAKGSMPVDGVLNIALDLADALTRAHRLQIIHRDIKPDNVLLAEDGTPRLTDFGVAHLGDRTRLTQTGSVIGTYAYLSPEACNGMDLDERTDIWSFGVMLYELLSGNPPFDENSTAAILTAIMTKPAPDLARRCPDAPPELVELIAKMLEKDRNHRVSSVRVIGAELEALIRRLDTPLRSLVLGTDSTPSAQGSRFVTPEEEGSTPSVPAMIRSTPGQTHGLSVYPTPSGGIAAPTPPTGETVVPRSDKWKWMAIMVGIVVLSCTMILLTGMILTAIFNNKDKKSSSQSLPALPDAAAMIVGHGQDMETSGQKPLTMQIHVEPVGPDETMVLVAQLEPRDPNAADVTGSVVEALTETLEVNVPFSNIRIREFPAVIRSSEEAMQAAQIAEATVVVWGSYDSSTISLDIQIGVLDHFPDNNIPLATLERASNIRVRLTDPREESIASYVMSIIGTLHAASGDAFEGMRAMAIMDAIEAKPAEIVSTGVASYLHRADQLLMEDTAQSRDLIDEAIALDAGNPVLYMYRTVADQRLGDLEAARQDVETAGRLGPANWAMPRMLKLNVSTNDSDILAELGAIIDLRPNDWYPLFIRGSMYYAMGELAAAQADMDAAIKLSPNANFPYVYGALIALHEGQITTAGNLMGIILTQFPDPYYMNRLVAATFGEQNPGPQGVIISAISNLVLGRYDQTLADVTAVLDAFPTSDFYVVQGFAYCGLGDYANAENAYTTGIQYDPSFIWAYLLRAEVRMKQRKYDEASKDILMVQENDQGQFGSLVEAIQTGELSCGNFFTEANPLLHMEEQGTPVPNAAVTPTPGPTAQASQPTPVMEEDQIAPVDAGQYLVLVAQLEPLNGVEPRDVTRFIVDDLEENLVNEVPDSRLAIRDFPGEITSDSAAQDAATSNGATVIVWGNYTPDFIELDIQLGVTTAFRYVTFTHSTLERSMNIRVRMTNERGESVAVYVANMINMLAAADGDYYEIIRSLAVLSDLDVTSPEISGQSVAAHLHRAIMSYLSHPQTALDEINAGLALDGGNPLLYAYRCGLYSIQNDDVRSDVDLQTAQRLGPDNWTFPLYINIGDDFQAMLDRYSEIIRLRPADWYGYYSRGEVYYMLGKIDSARADFGRALLRSPQDNSPYLFAMIIALHDGRMAQAQAAMRLILDKFPNPLQIKRTIEAVTGEQKLAGLVSSIGTNLLLGQYQDVVSDTVEVTAPMMAQPNALQQIAKEPSAMLIAGSDAVRGIGLLQPGLRRKCRSRLFAGAAAPAGL